jgi:hypothetical protein
MRSNDEVRQVFELWDQGLSKRAISMSTGVSRTQIRVWIEQGLDATLSSPMRSLPSWKTCAGECRSWNEADELAYAYLLGMYLGDGCISEQPPGKFKLRLSMCDDYPGIRAEAEAAIRAMRPGKPITAIQRIGCTELCSYWNHWVCLFPQHGPGLKYKRLIELAPWQLAIAMGDGAQPFLRGLIHSDGCRAINRVTRPTLAGPKVYSYPRYFFSNASRDILGLFAEACSKLEIRYAYNGPRSISVAQRDSVAKLDSFIGPKS